MTSYVDRRLEEKHREVLGVAVALHVALALFLLTVKVVDVAVGGSDNPSIQLTSFSNADPKRPDRTGEGGGGVEAILPIPSAAAEPSGSIDLPLPAPVRMPTLPSEASATTIDIGSSLTRDAELMFPDLISLPPYPAELERAGIETTLTLRLDIDADGQVTGATPIGSHHRGFVQSTVDHVKERWRFRPRMVDGRAVPTRRNFVFQFRVERCGDEFCQKRISSFAG